MAAFPGGQVAHAVFWLPCVFVVLHIVEEFVWPGGFLAWHRIYRPDLAAGITPRFAIIANLLLVAATVVLGVMGPGWSRGLSLWFVLASLLAGNAVWHARGSVRTRRYSPGVVTGIVLYVPLLLGGLWYFLDVRDASLQTIAIGCAMGITYQFWSDRLHRTSLGGRR